MFVDGLHFRNTVREKYQIPREDFHICGKLTGENLSRLRQVVYLLNKDKNRFKTGELNAVILITELIADVFDSYLQNVKPALLFDAGRLLRDLFGEKEINLLREEYIAEFTFGADQSLITEDLVKELVILYVTNLNPAFVSYKEIFDDAKIKEKTAYLLTLEILDNFFKAQPAAGLHPHGLIDFLLLPGKLHPSSIMAQLEYIRSHWGHMIKHRLRNLLTALDLMKEDEKSGLPGPGKIPLLRFTANATEPEAFTPDRNWMPDLVLIAKSTYVWLAQLSKKYKIKISTLDQIPAEELLLLQKRGFSGLWLIGIWERSKASRRIKHLCGSHDAVASAYSLMDYQIDENLGGERALAILKEKAAAYNIKLACDMVPNHMGIDSKWLLEHPDWFMQVDKPPYPAYKFNGEDLCHWQEAEVRIEDHYYDRGDAAVVFEYQDRRDGKTRYIYHGNDGTSTPWNDTAQLNYLLPEVRQAVKAEILRIADEFSVIRFDAAMTLAKKHYQRLWFPEPGTGGAIPSRAEHGLTKEEFDLLLPQEFWREVVDAINEKNPDTLLLAEAFWLMEGYFVRSLGMHRVYNSAFMHMLKNEENAQYRKSIFNTLEYNPEILKRFVNFMNNPDEEPAIIQFGKEDKYFGVCLMMATMPGLPMFGHGQVEGFHERYGMDFHSPKWDEKEDAYLIERHEREIFPFLRQRYLFSEVQNFRLYNFYTEQGVNENVFAYSNVAYGQRALIVYHNCYQTTEGHVGKADVFQNGVWQEQSLAEGLQLSKSENVYVIFKDNIKGLQYIRQAKELHEWGLNLNLSGYKAAAFTDFREVGDDEYFSYQKLAAFLQGGGVPDLEKAKKLNSLQPFLETFSALVNPETFTFLSRIRQQKNIQAWEDAKESIKEKIFQLVFELHKIVGGHKNPRKVAKKIYSDLNLWIRQFKDEEIVTKAGQFARAQEFYRELLHIFTFYSRVLLGWILIRRLGELADSEHPEKAIAIWFEELFIEDTILWTFKESKLNLDFEQSVKLLKVAVELQCWWKEMRKKSLYKAAQEFFANPDIRVLLKVNKWDEEEWFNKEAFDDFTAMLYLTNYTAIYSLKEWSNTKRRNAIIRLYSKAILFSRMGIRTGFKISTLMEALEKLA